MSCWLICRAPWSPRHACHTRQWSFFLSSKTSLQWLRIRQMSAFSRVSPSTRESRIDWRRHSGIFEGRKQDGFEDIRGLGWITGLLFSQPLTCGNYPRETFITLTCSFFCYPGSSNEVRPKDRGDDDHTVSNQRRGRENWTPWHDDYHHAAAAATMATSA